MIGAIILAAGMSRRMGQPKLALAWGGTTVIGQVVSTLLSAGVEQLVVVTGGDRAQVENALREQPVRLAFNPRYAEDQMALSLQVGLAALPAGVEAALVALGDQPQIEAEVVRAVMEEYRASRAEIVVPSYQMRRGHPWVVARSLWPALLSLQPPATLRDFLVDHAARIHYLALDRPSVLRDLDTPEDYRGQAPPGET